MKFTLLAACAALTVGLSALAFEPKSENKMATDLKPFLRIKPWYRVKNFLRSQGYSDLVDHSNIADQIGGKIMTKETLDAIIMQELGDTYSAEMRKTLSTKIRTSRDVSLVFYSKQDIGD